MLVFFLPETSTKNILSRRAERLRKLTGNNKLATEAEITFQNVTARKVAYVTIIRPWILTFTEPLVFLLHLWIALIFGILFIWLESFPLVFTGIYGFNLGENGLAFLGLLVGAMICIPPFIWYDHVVQRKLFGETGNITKPEMRLIPAMATAACIPICLFWFGWSARPDIHWIMPLTGTGFFAIGALVIVVSPLKTLFYLNVFSHLFELCTNPRMNPERRPDLPPRFIPDRDSFCHGRQRVHAILLWRGLSFVRACDVPQAGRQLGEQPAGIPWFGIRTNSIFFLPCEPCTLFPL